MRTVLEGRNRSGQHASERRWNPGFPGAILLIRGHEGWQGGSGGPQEGTLGVASGQGEGQVTTTQTKGGESLAGELFGRRCPCRALERNPSMAPPMSRSRLVGESNVRVARWVDKVLTVNSTVPVSSPRGEP
eukprot:1176074-Prorocentrum_minimum.AAC.4